MTDDIRDKPLEQLLSSYVLAWFCCIIMVNLSPCLNWMLRCIQVTVWV